MYSYYTEMRNINDNWDNAWGGTLIYKCGNMKQAVEEADEGNKK